MAIASALGPNIHNMFLALGFPWVINALVNGGQFEQGTNGVETGVIGITVSLGFFIFILAVGKWTIGRIGASALISC